MKTFMDYATEHDLDVGDHVWHVAQSAWQAGYEAGKAEARNHRRMCGMCEAAPSQEPVEKQLQRARRACEWYKRRCDLLQQHQSTMRDPERTIVCDILANGSLLEPAGDRYAAPSQEPVPIGATHYQPHQKTYYKRVSATEWYLWSCTGKGWIESKGTSDSADWVMLNPVAAPVRFSDGMTAEDDKQFNRQLDVKPLTPMWNVDADWLYSVLRYADKNPDCFPDVGEGKVTLDGSDAQIIIDALNQPDAAAQIAQLETELAATRADRNKAWEQVWQVNNKLNLAANALRSIQSHAIGSAYILMVCKDALSKIDRGSDGMTEEDDKQFNRQWDVK